MVENLNLSKDQLEEFREAFYLFDKDGDGNITKHELEIVMKTLGQNPTEEQLKAMIDEVDSDGSGCIELNEFLFLMDKKLKEQDTEEELIEAFKQFDRDGDGFITQKDLKAFLNSVGESMSDDDIFRMIQVANVSREKGVTYPNFVRMMMIPRQ